MTPDQPRDPQGRFTTNERASLEALAALFTQPKQLPPAVAQIVGATAPEPPPEMPQLHRRLGLH